MLAVFCSSLWLAAPLAHGAGGDALQAQALELARRSLQEQADDAGLLDAQLHLSEPAARARPACPGGWDLTVQDLRSLLRIRLLARCTDPGVPAQDFLLRATLSAQVLVLSEAVASGQPVGEAQVRLQRRELSQIGDALSTLEPGLAARASLRPGQLLQKRLLVAAQLIKRGDAVRIQASRAGISVEGSGEALDSGARQALIRVRNSASGRVIQARVLGPGLVEPAELR